MEKASILEMARGAIMEQVEVEVGKIVDNIIDLNTDPKKKRQLVLTVDFTPSADRSVVDIAATAKSKLQPLNVIVNRMKANLDVREYAKKAGVYLWQIAATIGVSEPTFNRRMRVEMSEAEKEQVKQVIDRIADKLNGCATV